MKRTSNPEEVFPVTPRARRQQMARKRRLVARIQLGVWIVCFLLTGILLLVFHSTLNRDSSAVHAAAHAGESAVYVIGVYVLCRAVHEAVARQARFWR